MKRFAFVLFLISLLVTMAEAQTWDWNLKRIKTVQSKNINADTLGKTGDTTLVRGRVRAKSITSTATGAVIDSFTVSGDTLYFHSGENRFASIKNNPVVVDHTPPAAITDLTATNVAANSVTLNFTAPSDDQGVVSAYDARYSIYTMADSLAGGGSGSQFPTIVAQNNGIMTSATADTIRLAIDCGTLTNRGLVVGVSWFYWGVESITGVYNRTTGTTLTKAISDTIGYEAMRQEVWYMANPATGVNYITVKFSANLPDAGMSVSAWRNVNQTTPISGAVSDTGHGATPSVVVTSTSSKAVIDFAMWYVGAWDVTQSPTAPQVLINDISQYPLGLGYDVEIASSYKTGTTSSVMSWALGSPTGPWIISALNIEPSTGGADTTLWANANLFLGEPTPKTAGQSESFVLSGLAANTTYFVRVKSSDPTSNISALSNQVSFTTAAGEPSTPGTLASTYYGFPGGPSISGGATGYYLDSAAANDAGNGKTPATAKKTWAALESLFGTEAGYDTVWIRKGTYSQNVKFQYSGTVSQPLVFMRYGNEEVIFEGANDNLVPVIDWNWKANVIVQGIKVRDGEWNDRRYADANGANYLVNLLGGENNKLRWCYVVSLGDSAELMFGGTGIKGQYHPRGVAAVGRGQVIEHCFIRGWDMGLVLGGNAPVGGQNQVVSHDTIVCCLWSNIVSLGNDVISNTNEIRRLIEYCRLDTTWAEDLIQTEHRLDPLGWTYNPNNHKGLIVRYCTGGFAGENCIDFKGVADIFVYGNTWWQSWGDNDGPWYDGITGAVGQALITAWDGGTYPAMPRHVVVTYNVIGDGNGAVGTNRDWQLANNTFLNNRRNYLGPNKTTGVNVGVELYTATNHKKVFINNIMTNHSPQMNALIEYSPNPHTFNNNAYYDTSANNVWYCRYVDGVTMSPVTGLTNWKSVLTGAPYANILGKEVNSIEARPVFTSNTTTPVGKQVELYDWTPVAGSALLGGGMAVTYTLNSGINSVYMTVDNASLFHGEWPGVTEGQLIYVGSDITGKRARAVTVDWTTNQIVLDTPLTWNSGEPVHWSGMPSYNGKPNIGAK